MNEQEIQIRVQQIREELERMQPDIDQKVNEQFGEDFQTLQNDRAGTMRNIQMTEQAQFIPNVPEEEQQRIIGRFNENLTNLHNEAEAVRDQLKDERARFLIETYVEDGTAEDKQAIANILQVNLTPPEEAGQGDYFNPDDFAYVDELGDWENGDLGNEFNNAAAPPHPPLDEGIEP